MRRWIGRRSRPSTFVSRPKCTARISRAERPGRHVFCHDGASADHNTFRNNDARQQDCPRADEDVAPDFDVADR
jgi:hypothetical protein